MFKGFREIHHARQRAGFGGAVIIGAAFGKIGGALVNDIIMPAARAGAEERRFHKSVRHLSGGHPATLAQAKAAATQPSIMVCSSHVIDFLISRLRFFLMIHAPIAERAPAPAAPNTKECPFCHHHHTWRRTRCPMHVHTH